MRVSPKILEKLTNDLEFRLKTALALKCGERNVQYLIQHNSQKLTDTEAVRFYRSTGLTDEEIFEQEPSNA